MMNPERPARHARGAPSPPAPARRRRVAPLHSVASQGPHALRFALRTIAAGRGLFAIRVVTLALVVGAGSAVFLVADAMLLRPLPFKHAERLVRVFMQPPGRPDFTHANPLHPLEFVRIRERPGALERLEGIWAAERAIGGDGEPESVPAASVSAGLFDLLGSAPALGRTFTEDEARQGKHVVVLSHGIWTRRFGSDPGIVGRNLMIDRRPYEVAGVMGPGFDPVFVQSEFWTPLEVREGHLILPGATFIQSVGRIREGSTIEQARTELEATLAAVTLESPTTLKGWTVDAMGLRQAQYGPQLAAVTLLLVAIVALSLIATANLANLTLAEVLARRDIAVRVALGASRADLVWPEAVKSALIGGAGAAGGLLLAVFLLPALVALDPSGALRGIPLALPWRVVAGAVALAVLIVGVAAIVPTLRVAGQDAAGWLAEGGRRAAGGPRHERLRSWLLATQTAIALGLLVTGGLVAAGFEKTSRIDPGFDRTGVLTAQLRLPEVSYESAQSRASFVDAVLTRVRAIPGVVDAATTMNLFVPGFAFVTLVHVEGRPTADGQPHTVQFRRISEGYFRTLRIPRRLGREFDGRDAAAGLPAAVVSESFARRFWPGEDPIGRRVRRAGATAPWVTIVGVVGDVHDVGYGQVPEATIYIPYAQNNVVTSPVSLVVRASGDPLGLTAAVKAAVWSVDPAQPLASVGTLDRFLHDSLGPQRFRTVLLALFGSLGLLLAAVGIYGVTSRTVVERTREAGVRLALGGHPRRIWWTIAARALKSFGAGAAAGLAASMVSAAILASVFPELAGASVGPAALSAALLLVTGAAAALGAAHRISRVDPLTALRAD
jgi:predicted permease